MKPLPRTLVVVAVGGMIVVAGAAEPQSALDPAASIEQTRAALSKWVETQQIIAKEKNEWQEAKDILQSRTELVKSEIATLEQKIREADAGAREAEQKKTELVAQDAALKEAAAALREAAGDLEGKVRRLYQILPEPLQAKIQPLFQRMPADPKNTKVTLAERFQNVLGILNEVNKLNGEITLATEVRPLSDGKPAEVKTLYVGLGQAYFVSPQGEAGVGRPGESGWQWQAANRLSGDIAEAISVLQGKGTPKFISLPVKVQ